MKKLLGFITLLIAMILSLGAPQSAAASSRVFEPVAYEVSSVAILPADKVAVIADRKNRQTVTSYRQLKQHGAGSGDCIVLLKDQDHWTKVPREPAWRM